MHLTIAALLARARRPGVWIKRLSTALVMLVVLQLGAGALNVKLMAPIWMQLVHLLLSDLVWIALLLLMAVALAPSFAPQGMLRPSESMPCAEEVEEALKNYPALTRSQEG